MKSIILVIFGLILIFLTSYIALSQESPSFTLKTFIIEDNKENTETGYNNLQTFVIGEKPTAFATLINTIRQTRSVREHNIEVLQQDEEIEKCIGKITKNWQRTYGRTSFEKEFRDGKWTIVNIFSEKDGSSFGYDEKEDFNLRWRLRNRALNGEKIC